MGQVKLEANITANTPYAATRPARAPLLLASPAASAPLD
jgi:hypothetical protein